MSGSAPNANPTITFTGDITVNVHTGPVLVVGSCGGHSINDAIAQFLRSTSGAPNGPSSRSPPSAQPPSASSVPPSPRPTSPVFTNPAEARRHRTVNILPPASIHAIPLPPPPTRPNPLARIFAEMVQVEDIEQQFEWDQDNHDPMSNRDLYEAMVADLEDEWDDMIERARIPVGFNYPSDLEASEEIIEDVDMEERPRPDADETDRADSRMISGVEQVDRLRAAIDDFDVTISNEHGADEVEVPEDLIHVQPERSQNNLEDLGIVGQDEPALSHFTLEDSAVSPYVSPIYSIPRYGRGQQDPKSPIRVILINGRIDQASSRYRHTQYRSDTFPWIQSRQKKYCYFFCPVRSTPITDYFHIRGTDKKRLTTQFSIYEEKAIRKFMDEKENMSQILVRWYHLFNVTNLRYCEPFLWVCEEEENWLYKTIVLATFICHSEEPNTTLAKTPLEILLEGNTYLEAAMQSTSTMLHLRKGLTSEGFRIVQDLARDIPMTDVTDTEDKTGDTTEPNIAD